MVANTQQQQQVCKGFVVVLRIRNAPNCNCDHCETRRGTRHISKRCARKKCSRDHSRSTRGNPPRITPEEMQRIIGRFLRDKKRNNS